MNRKFKIMISSDITYQKLVSEIYYNDDLIAQISQDDGIDQPKIRIFQSDILFSLKEFSETIEQAIKKLKD